MQVCKIAVLTAFALGVSACGGGGGGGDKNPPQKTYFVKATVSQGGSVDIGQSTIAENAKTAFNFTPATGYHIKSVTGCGGALAGSTFTTGAITSACTVSAEFELNSYALTVTSSGGGNAIAQNPTIAYGEKGKVIATANAGYGVDTFSGCGAGSADDNIYTTAVVTADCSVSVSFKKVVIVEGTAAEGAALANAKVLAKCADGTGFTSKVEADATGHFTGQVGETALPCALSVTTTAPEKTYYSVASQAGIVNITLLTDLSIVLASGKTGSEWFASRDWEKVIPKLPNAQASLKTVLANIGYEVPAEDFSPFTSAFEVGDALDLLLDQIQAGIEKSDSLKTYDALVAAVKTGELTGLPTPNGNQDETAEVCFNPSLFAEDTTYTTVSSNERTMTQDGVTTPYINTEHVTYTNEKIVNEDGRLVLKRKSYTESQDVYSNGPSPKYYYEGYTKYSLNFDAKALGVLEFYIKPANTDESFTWYYKVAFTGDGGARKFKLPKGKSSTQLYDFYIYDGSGFQGEYTWKYSTETTSQFKGIIEVERAGAKYKVCHFDVVGKETVMEYPENSIIENPVTTYNSKQYFLVGSGVEVTNEGLTSIVLSGKELLNGQPN